MNKNTRVEMKEWREKLRGRVLRGGKQKVGGGVLWRGRRGVVDG